MRFQPQHTQLRVALRNHDNQQLTAIGHHDVPALGFQLRHIAGSVERLTTYLMGEQISPEQIAFLKQEAEPGATLEELLAGVDAALSAAEARMRTLAALVPLAVPPLELLSAIAPLGFTAN